MQRLLVIAMLGAVLLAGCGPSAQAVRLCEILAEETARVVAESEQIHAVEVPLASIDAEQDALRVQNARLNAEYSRAADVSAIEAIGRKLNENVYRETELSKQKLILETKRTVRITGQSAASATAKRLSLSVAEVERAKCPKK